MHTDVFSSQTSDSSLYPAYVILVLHTRPLVQPVPCLVLQLFMTSSLPCVPVTIRSIFVFTCFHENAHPLPPPRHVYMHAGVVPPPPVTTTAAAAWPKLAGKDWPCLSPQERVSRSLPRPAVELGRGYPVSTRFGWSLQGGLDWAGLRWIARACVYACVCVRSHTRITTSGYIVFLLLYSRACAPTCALVRLFSPVYLEKDN